MSETNFKVGDRLRFRQWNDMLNEYGCDASGDIFVDNKTFFTRQMKDLCGVPFTVKNINPLISEENNGCWYFCSGMLEYDPQYNDLPDVNSDDFEKILQT